VPKRCHKKNSDENGAKFHRTMYAVSDVFQMHQIQRTVSSFAAE